MAERIDSEIATPEGELASGWRALGRNTSAKEPQAASRYAAVVSDVGGILDVGRRRYGGGLEKMLPDVGPDCARMRNISDT